MATKIEFAVEMTCKKCVIAIEDSLKDLKGIDKVDISLDQGSVIVETNLPYSVVQERIESSGRRSVLKGCGDGMSAVAMIGGNSNFGINDDIQGIVRFIQTNEGSIIDGTIDGLNPGAHGLHIHECGDISGGCATVGPHFNPHESKHGGPDNDINNRHVGDLGNIIANNSGRTYIRFHDKILNIADIIGRSLVVTAKKDDLGKGNDSNSVVDGNSGEGIACGVIARSAGLFGNTKKICACDGKTLWDERNDFKQKGLLTTVSSQFRICDIS